MAITILNPARFNDDGGVGGRQYIRAAFFDEGYGSSTSFKAYAQGAGIVPATAAFDIIGAGTAGDPLRMSQFSGFTVPSLSLDTQTLTSGGSEFGGGEDTTSFSGYLSGNFGSISDGTFNVKSGRTIIGLYDDYSVGAGSGTLYFKLVAGTVLTNAGWTTMTIISNSEAYNSTFLRTNAFFSSSVSGTTWYWSVNDRALGQGSSVSEVFTVTFT